MFSKQLEDLIQATLEDGILEDYEKEALVKRATAEGVDLTELEIYINSLLQKRQKELNEKKNALDEKYEKEKKEALGRTCPQCGKQVPPLTLVCECGFEFTGNKQQSAVQLLYEKISNIQLTDEEIDSCSWIKEEKVGRNYQIVKDSKGDVVRTYNKYKMDELKNQKKIDIIQSFPVPNTKEDIMDFLALAAPNSKTKEGLWGKVKSRTKTLSIIAAILFVIFFYFGLEETKKIGEALGWGVTAVFVLGFLVGFICLVHFADPDTERYNKLANAWRAKFDQVLMKGRSLRADPEFKQMLDYYENLVYKK